MKLVFYIGKWAEKKLQEQLECHRDDCQQDKDNCVDCFGGDKYKSPDQPDMREDR